MAGAKNRMTRSTSASRWPSRAMKTTRRPATAAISASALPTIPSGTEASVTAPPPESAALIEGLA